MSALRSTASPPQEARKRRTKTAATVRIIRESVVGAAAREVNERLGAFRRTGIVKPMDLIEFLSLEAPFLLAAARKDPSRDAVLAALDQAFALGKDEAAKTLYPG